MLQQTQVVTVIPYFKRFITKFPNIYLLAESELQDVLKIWEGLGYYGRARNLHKSAKIIRDDFQGKIPDEYNLFLKLPGVGEYIASAVLSIAFNKAFAVVDGNVKRVLSRIFLLNYPVNDPKSHKIYAESAERLLNNKIPGRFNQAMMELGATVCIVKKPLCSICPVINFCEAYKMKRQSEYPKRKPRKKVPVYPIAVGVVEKNGMLLITKRKEKGLLGGLWEFPGGKIIPGESGYKTCEREIMEEVNLTVRANKHLATVKHAYTHFKIVMEVYLCYYVKGRVSLNASDDFCWITPEQLSYFPFPGANHKFFPTLKKYYNVSK
jgi:A/G-specific adenine glycosylase